MMDTLFGLPAHPFLVHVPIVLLPVAAVGVVLMVIKREWHQRFRWVVLALGFIGTVGAILAAGAGEELEARIERIEGEAASSGWEHHAELGDTARGVAILFFLLLAAYVLIPWFLDRRAASATPATPATEGAAPTSASPKWLSIALAVLVVGGAAASVTTIIQAGHTGSESVWKEVVDNNGG